MNTFIQSVSLRSQPVLSSVEFLDAQNLDDYDFGSDFSGIQDVWILKFASETADAWKYKENNTYMLVKDFDKMPVHTILDETANINPEIVDTSTVSKNTYFNYRQNI